ncbi:CAP domain-containing protein [Parvibaculum sp.]|uniref:CAP domain-containing protein n=1 Tax=Parvibaculum sp. TaxID=2024848 RepID=UPI00320D119F
MPQISRLLTGVAMALTLAACATQGPGEPQKPQRVSLTTLPAGASAAAQGETALSRAILDAVNAWRGEKGIAPLAPDATLQRAAAIHSADMSLRNFVGSFNPDGQGTRERVLAVDPNRKGDVFETISLLRDAASQPPQAVAGEVVKSWTVDPARRKVLRDATLTRSGVGVATKGSDLYVTEVFATE